MVSGEEKEKEAEQFEKWLAQAEEGDMYAFERIVKDVERIVYTVSFRMMGNEEDAKDVTQEVFIKMYANLGKWQTKKALVGWLCTVAKNSSIDLFRKRKRKQTESLDEATGDDSQPMQYADNSPSPEQAVLQKETMKDLQSAINSLSLEHRTAIVLRDIQGFSYETIANTTNATIGTVKSRIFRAREQMKKIIKKRMEQNENGIV